MLTLHIAFDLCSLFPLLLYSAPSSVAAHLSYVGGNGANPVVVSLVQLDKRKQGYGFSGLVRTKKDDLHYSFVSKDKKSALKHLLRTVPDLQGTITLTYVKDPSLSDELAHMEDRMLIKAYRVGVVYAGLSVDENEMFSNAEPSPGFLNFMDWLGKRIKLKGYTGFKGGLDLEHNTTGTHSYATDVQGFDIMFHVSTELPLSTLNPQQVERKRHIGNDVAVIIYQDGPTSKPFAATGITSKFNHVYLVVQAIPDETTATTAPTAGKDSTAAPAPRRRPSKAKNKRGPIEIEVDGIASDQRTPTASQSAIPSRYRLAVVSKHGVRAHGPVLPAPDHVWTLDDTFRNFLLAKTVNAERAAYYAPGFGQARTRRLWLKSLLEKYGPPQKHGSVSPDSLDG